MSEKDDGLSCWRELITLAMEEAGDDWGCVVSCTLDDEGLDRRFYDGFGSAEGAAFTLWTFTNVYFPREYDGAEQVGWASRHPDGKPTRHQ